MVNKQVALALLAVTLFGALSGFAVTLIRPVSYQAEAYVVVYEMPKGFTNIIGPDEAAHLNDVYQAGVLQDAVVKRVRQTLPQYSAQTLAQSIQVEIVAYTPFTRITATATAADSAANLANTVAQAWALVAGTATNQAYDSTKATLESREQTQLQQIATVQDALEKVDATSAAAQTLQTELNTLEDERSTTAANIQALGTLRLNVAGNAYVAIRANTSDAVKSPDLTKYVALGAGIGLSLGLMFVLWLTRRRWKRDGEREALRGAAAAVASPSASASVSVSAPPAVRGEVSHGW